MKELLSALALTACVARHTPETSQPNDSRKSERAVLATLDELGQRLQEQADLVASHVDRISRPIPLQTCYPQDEYAPKPFYVSSFTPVGSSRLEVNFNRFSDLGPDTLLPANQPTSQGAQRRITTLSVVPNPSSLDWCIAGGKKEMPQTELVFNSQRESNPYREMAPEELAYGYVNLTHFSYPSDAICAQGIIEARILELRMNEPYTAIQNSQLFDEPSRYQEFALEWVTATCPAEGERAEDGEIPEHANTLDWFNFRAFEEEIDTPPGVHSTSTEHWAARVYALPNDSSDNPKVQWTYPNIAAVESEEGQQNAAIFQVRDPRNSAVLKRAEAIFDAAWGPLDSLSKR